MTTGAPSRSWSTAPRSGRQPGTPLSVARPVRGSIRPGVPRTTVCGTRPPGRLGDRLGDERGEVRCGGQRTGRRPRRGARDVGDAHVHGVAAQVHPGDVGAVGDQPVEPGVRAPPVGAGLPRDLDQAAGAQPLDQVGHRGPRQPGQRPQLRGGQRAALQQQVQREPVVDRAGHRGVGGLHGPMVVGREPS
ncbi:hypothetical protein LUX39_53960 [Actinomadura madurae]|nr:hypothetical protein [Actinomadura madurae]MCQ0021457.1 hypothetical protein [Actinomadura madurae]